MRASGLNYAIVRPGGLCPGGLAGTEGMALEQGDKKGGSYILIPDLAALMAWVLDNPDADAKTFEVLSDPHAPPMAWQDALTKLAADP